MKGTQITVNKELGSDMIYYNIFIPLNHLEGDFPNRLSRMKHLNSIAKEYIDRLIIKNYKPIVFDDGTTDLSIACIVFETTDLLMIDTSVLEFIYKEIYGCYSFEKKQLPEEEIDV